MLLCSNSWWTEWHTVTAWLTHNNNTQRGLHIRPCPGRGKQTPLPLLTQTWLMNHLFLMVNHQAVFEEMKCPCARVELTFPLVLILFSSSRCFPSSHCLNYRTSNCEQAKLVCVSGCKIAISFMLEICFHIFLLHKCYYLEYLCIILCCRGHYCSLHKL